jgi:LacI family transcriptional regulator
MADIAKHAKVGIGTVSRVINNSAGVREATRQKVLTAIKELDYRQTRVARALVQKGVFAPTIGVLSQLFSARSHQAMIVGAHRMAASRGYHLLMLSPPPGADLGAAVERAIRQFHVDGIMIVGYQPAGSLSIRQIVGPLMPVVATGRAIEGITSVYADSHRVGTLAAEHVWSRGVRRPAIIALGRYPTRSDTFMGFYRDHGVADVESRLRMTPEITEKDGYDLTNQLLSGNPDGFFYCSDTLAVGGLQRLRAGGLKLPVIGADNLNFAGPMGLTTVDLQFETMGRIGFEMLAWRIEGHRTGPESGADCNILMPQLIVRDT